MGISQGDFVKIVKNVWRSYPLIFIRIVLLLYIGMYFLSDNFDRYNSLAYAVGIAISGLIIFVIADLTSFNGGYSLIQAESIVVDFIKDEMSGYYTFNDVMGVYRVNPVISEDKVKFEYIPISNAEEAGISFTGFLRLLQKIKTSDSEKLQNRISFFLVQTEYMANNPQMISTIER